MTILYPSTSFNPASVQADGVYLSIQNPPGFISGVPTDVFGNVGSADWGPVNTPVHMGSPFDALQLWGPVSAASLTDPYDLATDLAVLFGQATSQATLEGWSVRVTDGTDVVASVGLAGAATSISETVTVGGTVHTGDVLNVVFTSSALTGSPITVTYTVKSTDTTLALAAAGLAAAINANAVLAAAGFTAIAPAAVISVYQPTTLSPQATYGSSVTGGGATTTLTLATGAAVTSGLTLQALYTGALGNQIQAIVQAGAAASTWTVILALPAISVREIFPNLPQATFYAALKTALASGLSGVRGPSQLCRGGAVNNAVGAPTATTATLSGGLSGRAGVNTAALLGSDTVVPKTGLYALRGLNPGLGCAYVVGSTDSTLATPLKAFADTEGPEVFLALPVGTTTAAGVTAVQANGAAGPEITYAKDWVYWFDAINNVTRLVPPTPFIVGTICTTAPQVSPGNELVALVQGTERNNPQSGANQPYSLSEIGQLASAGIMIVTSPIPQGAVWGTPHGQSTALDPVVKGINWWRTTVFLARSINARLGQYVDMLQSQQPNDPLRNTIKNDLNSFLSTLTGANGAIGVIDSFAVICAFKASGSSGNGINTPTSIAQGFLYVLVKVTYLGTARFIIAALQGGTTVVSVGTAPAGQRLSS